MQRSVAIALLSLVSAVHGAPAGDGPESLIPLEKLDAPARARVSEVVPGHVLYRNLKMSGNIFRARRDVFEYLIGHLDLTTILAQRLGIMDHRALRLPDGGYWTETSDGSLGYLWPLREAGGENVYFVRGVDREGRSIDGRAVVVFRYREIGPGRIAWELHAFVRIEHVLKRFLMKLLMPFVIGTVDRRFSETLAVPVRVAECATADPERIVRLVDSLRAPDRVALAEFRALLLRGKGRLPGP